MSITFPKLLEYSSDDDLLKKAHLEFLRMLSSNMSYGSKIISFSVGNDTSISCKTFIHLTTVTKNGNRVLDVPRTCRIHWIESVFQQYKHKDIKVYSKETNCKVRHYFLIPKYFYLTIIEENNRGFFVVTSYHLDNQNRVNSYMQEYKKYRN